MSWFLFKSPTKKNQDWIVCFNSLFIIPGVWYRLVYTLHLHILGARLNMVCVAPGGSDSYNYVVRSLTLWQRADLPTRLCFYGFSSIKTPENKPGFPKSKLNWIQNWNKIEKKVARKEQGSGSRLFAVGAKGKWGGDFHFKSIKTFVLISRGELIRAGTKATTVHNPKCHWLHHRFASSLYHQISSYQLAQLHQTQAPFSMLLCCVSEMATKCMSAPALLQVATPSVSCRFNLYICI